MAKKIDGLPVYNIALGDGDVGVYATSIVAKPATKSDFLKFNEDKPQFKFYTNPLVEAEVVDAALGTPEELMEIVGALMIPDMPIYRNAGGRQFYVNFTREVIRDLVNRMNDNGLSSMFTVEHSFETNPTDVQLMDVWIKEDENDKSVDLGFNEPIGTAFMRAKINSKPLWGNIKDNGLNGFSIELDASIVETFSAIDKAEEEKEDIKKEDVNMIEKMFNSHIENNGTKLYFNDELKEGTPVFQDVEGIPTAYTGEVMHGDNKFVIEKGLIKEVENIQLSTDEKISTLADKFSELGGKLASFFEREKTLEEKEADITLREKQLEKKSLAFSEGKKVGEEENIKQRRLKFAADNKWINKF